jgi:hypothetical protein
MEQKTASEAALMRHSTSEYDRPVLLTKSPADSSNTDLRVFSLAAIF